MCASRFGERSLTGIHVSGHSPKSATRSRRQPRAALREPRDDALEAELPGVVDVASEPEGARQLPPLVGDLAPPEFTIALQESDLADDARWTAAMARRTTSMPATKIRATAEPELAALLERAEAGEEIYLVPPGLDASGHVLVHVGPLPR